MLYEMVEQVLDSLSNQWQAVADTLTRFARKDDFPAGDVVRKAIFELDGATPPKPLPTCLVGQCLQLKVDVVSERAGARTWTPASNLLSHFNLFFRLQEIERELISNNFLGLFPLPLSTVDFEVCKTLFERVEEFIEDAVERLEAAASEEANRVNIGRIRGAVEDIASYPILTSEYTPAPSPGAGQYDGGGGGTVSLKRTVDGAIRQVLGRLPRAADTRSFIVSLKQSFEVVQQGGYTVMNWTPRSYAGQTDLGGGVTGAQASLYTRAEVALDKALPLLDGLYPLLPEHDPQLIEAARMIVRSELSAVVKEMAAEGGPTIARIEVLFESLLDRDILEDGVPVKDGHLGYLRTKFGLEKNRVNTLEEETNFSNFLVLEDYVTSIRDSFDRFRDELRGKDLGTNLVLLSRALSVTAESVEEIHAAMDSVFVAANERQVAAFPDGDGNLVLVDDLLKWVVTFASEEAPALVHEGGRRGIEAIVPTARKLEGLVRRFIDAIPTEPLLPDGLRHPRVIHPLRELRGYLQRVQNLAAGIA